VSDLRFPRWLASVGVLGGVAIAVALPAVVLMLGDDLTPSAKLVVIILGLLVGAALAGVSAVVGITIPTAVGGAALRITKNGASLAPMADCCQPPQEGESQGGDCCSPVEGEPRTS
jgi:hypothetical protein